MARTARIVLPGLPHHVTQRGNRRADVFFTDEDRATYLRWLKEYAHEAGVAILGYCLMANHIHLVAVPKRADGLERLLRPLHTRHAQRINRREEWSGHLWQGRYFASALDDAHLWAALRYVDRNPVRARLVRKAENYRWSSAAAHCGLREDGVLDMSAAWRRRLAARGDWAEFLAEGDEPERIKTLRAHVQRGLPCGSAAFVRKLERQTGAVLHPRPRGRPRKTDDAPRE
jgi:putative transposase